MFPAWSEGAPEDDGSEGRSDQGDDGSVSLILFEEVISEVYETNEDDGSGNLFPAWSEDVSEEDGGRESQGDQGHHGFVFFF